MAKYSIERIVNAILSLKQLKKMSNYATSKVGKDVRVLSEPVDSCYSSHNYWNGVCIMLGKNFYPVAFEDTEDVDVNDLKDKYRHISKIIFGAYYHELFHLLFTPFGYASELVGRCNSYFQDFVHQVANILEDITIEGAGVYRYPFSEQYLLELREVFKLESQLKAVTSAIEDEPDNPGTLLAYLLHFCRGTNMSKFPEYKLWEDNKKFIEWGARKCIDTIDAETRAKRQVAFALELTKILDMKAPDKDNVENPDLSDIENQSNGFNKSSEGKGLSAVKNATGGNSYTKESGENSLRGNTTPQSGETTKQEKASLGGSGEDPCSNVDLTKASASMLANDEPVSRYSHFADKLNHYMDTRRYLPEYNKYVMLHDKQIRSVVSLIRKMIATNNEDWRHYQMNGKVDMSTIYKEGNYKVFKKRKAPQEAADLVFEILVDNSGSMRGTKSRLAGQALIIFCEALNRLHIPFSVDCFTESRAAITISLKDYNEPYDRVKTNLTLITEQYDCNKLSTFSGNIDEINLRYVADELALRKEKDKVLIVLSDGATCGDWRTLKKVAENIESSGISVLGIGLCDHNVSDIYRNSFIVETTEDLQNLGQFLNRYLIGKIFK